MYSKGSSPVATQNQLSLPYDQMFDMGDVDAQSDDAESNQDLGFGGADPSVDSDFNDIYYQCRYERYAAFSRAALLNEVLSLCANIDRLQHEKSEVEKRLRDVQQHMYGLKTTPSGSEVLSTNEEGNQTNEDDSRVRKKYSFTSNIFQTNLILSSTNSSSSAEGICDNTERFSYRHINITDRETTRVVF